MLGYAYRSVLDLSACRILSKEVVSLPIERGADWRCSKAAPAVWAHIGQDRVDAIRTKCAFIGTDARFQRVGRQCLLAIFTHRPELKHWAIRGDAGATLPAWNSS
jgi:hypothetical protein